MVVDTAREENLHYVQKTNTKDLDFDVLFGCAQYLDRSDILGHLYSPSGKVDYRRLRKIDFDRYIHINSGCKNRSVIGEVQEDNTTLLSSISGSSPHPGQQEIVYRTGLLGTLHAIILILSNGEPDLMSLTIAKMTFENRGFQASKA